jgi:hypothetical protein
METELLILRLTATELHTTNLRHLHSKQNKSSSILPASAAIRAAGKGNPLTLDKTNTS